MEKFVMDTLKEQMTTLVTRSKDAASCDLTVITDKLMALAKLLVPELRNQSACEPLNPYVGHLSMSDLQALAQARHERECRAAEELKRLYKDLELRQARMLEGK